MSGAETTRLSGEGPGGKKAALGEALTADGE